MFSGLAEKPPQVVSKSCKAAVDIYLKKYSAWSLSKP